MKALSVKVAGIVLAAGALAVTVGSLEMGWCAETALGRVLAGRSDVKVVGIAVHPLDGAVELRGVTATAGLTHIQISRLRLPLGAAEAGLITPAKAEGKPGQPTPPLESATPAGTGTASAENVVIVQGGMTYRIAKIDLAGTPLTSADLTAMLDPQNKDDIETRVRRLTAASVIISEMTADGSFGTAEQHWVQKQILLADVVKGKAAYGSSGSAHLALKSDQDVSNIEIGGTQMRGIDLGALIHVFGTARTSDSEPLVTMYESVVLNGIKVTDVTHDQVFTIATLKEDGLKGRPLKTEIRNQSAALANAKPNDPAYTAFLDDFMNSISVSLIEIDDVATEPKSGKLDDYNNFGLTKFAIHDFGGGNRLGSMDMTGVRFENKQGKMALASAGMTSLSFPQLGQSDAGPVPTLEKFDIANLNVNINTADKGDPEQRFAFGVGGAHYEAPGIVVGKLPPTSTIVVDDVTFDVPPNDPSTQMVRDLGYSRFDLSSRITNKYDAAQQTMSVDNFILTNPGIGTVQLKIDLANVSNGIVSPNQSVQKASLIAILFKGTDLVVRNDGIVEKALAYKAKQDGKTVAEERDALIDFVSNQLPAQLGDPPKLRPVGAALVEFLNTPKSLHLNVSTKSGLGVADAGLLNDPLALLEQLDIKADANQ